MAEQTNGLERLRAKRGFANRQKWADALGVDRVSTWRWETGRQMMSATQCREVAKLLGVTMEQVVRLLEEE